MFGGNLFVHSRVNSECVRSIVFGRGGVRFISENLLHWLRCCTSWHLTISTEHVAVEYKYGASVDRESCLVEARHRTSDIPLV